jgi:Ca-activated chloride channel family protein
MLTSFRMDFADPHFAEPTWLWLAVLGPLALMGLQWYAARARLRQMEHLASRRFLQSLLRSVSPARRRLKRILLILAVAGMGMTLARPQWGRLPDSIQTASEDIVFLLDSSRSMLSTDVRPNRLERAKLAILDFLQTHPGGRIGLVVFAGQAFLQCPLTFDHEALRESLLAVNDHTIPVGGTDLGRALSEAVHAVENRETPQVMILLSDGEDLKETGLDVAERLAETNIVLHTVGVGTIIGGDIPIQNEQGQPDVLRDEAGRVVRTRLDEETLRQIASITGGTYQPLGALGQGLVEIQLQLQTARTAASRPSTGAGVDRFHVPLALLTLLLVMESLIGTRRSTVQAGGDA